MSKDIHELIHAFHHDADQLSADLGLVNGRLREGRAPTARQVERLTEGLGQIRQRYLDVYEAAQNLSREELKPDRTVDEYLKAAAVGIQTQKLEELLKLRVVLDEFLSIRSNKEKYEALLGPLRQEAFGLVDAMEKPRLEDVDQLLEQVQGPRYFVEAVREEPGSARLGLLIEEKLNDRYPAEVLLGFFTNAYEIGDGPVSRETALPPAPKKQKGRKAPEPRAAGKPEKAPAPKPAPVRKPESRPAEVPPVIWSASASEAPAGVIEAVNRVKTSPANGSSFRSRLMKMDADMVAVPLLQLLDVFGLSTPLQLASLASVERMMFDADGRVEEVLSRVLDGLADRGWVAKYWISEASEFGYGITGFAAGSMRKETVQKTFRSEWPLTFSEAVRTFDSKESEMRLLNEYAQKEALLDYLEERESEIGFDIYRQVVESVTWNKDHYQLLVYARGPESPQRYNIVTPSTASAIPAGEPVIIVGDPHLYSRELIEDWKAPVLCLDLHAGGPALQDARIILAGAEEPQAAPAEAPEACPPDPDEAVPLIDSTLLSDMGPLDDSRLLPAVQRSLNRPCAPDQPDRIREAVVESVSLAKAGALASGVQAGRSLSRQLQLAANIVLDDLDYTGAELADVFPADGTHPEAYLLGAYAFALLAPGMAGDYVLRSRAQTLLQEFEQHFPSLPEFRQILKVLLDVAEKTDGGFSPAAMDMLGGKNASEHYLRTLREDAGNYAVPVTPNINLKALAPIYKKLFGLGSAFQSCMKIIEADQRSRRDEVMAELDRFCTVNPQGGPAVDAGRIDAVLDEYWDTFCRNKNNRKLSYHARDQVIRLMRVRLDLMLRWVEYVDSVEKGPREQDELRRLRRQLLDAVGAAQNRQVWSGHEHANLLQWILMRLRQRVEGPVDDRRLFNVFLLTGHVMLSDDGRPMLDDRFSSIRRYAPWTLVARHIEDRTGPVRRNATFARIREEIDGTAELTDDGLLDNLQQLEMIGKLTDEPADECVLIPEQVEEAISYADAMLRSFEEKLELYRMLGQITDEEKTALQETALGSRDFFYSIRNLASWREFLDAVAWEGSWKAQKRTDLLLDQIEERRDAYGDSPALAEAQELLERPVPNLTLAEEALNVYDIGLEPEEPSTGLRSEQDAFSEFRRDVVYRTLYEECRRQGSGTSARPLKRFGTAFFEKHHPADWPAEFVADSTQLLQSWPASKGAPTTKHIVTVLQRLGFPVSGAERTQMQKNAELYKVDAVPVAATGGPYAHPIAAFGTELPEKLDVIVIYGPCTGEDLFATLAGFRTDTLPVVLLDYQLDQGQRRVIAELFRTHSDQQAFVLIDRVLAMYLSMTPPDARLSCLLQCTLPYAGLQPFASPELPDELFSGRSQELAALLDPSGPVIVYGGRQTGKTALLRHAQRLADRPDDRALAVYADLTGLRDEASVSAAVTEAVSGKLPGELTPAGSFAELRTVLGQLLSEGKADSLLILLDNADDYLESIVPQEYDALQPLLDPCPDGHGTCKVVLAGTVQAVRAARHLQASGLLTEAGGGLRLGQLRQSEAEELLKAPLEYLGFRMGHRGEVETMLANTNYYPGVVKKLGCTLVDTLAEHSSKYYSASAGNPPYPLRSTELGAVMHSPELHKSIREAVQLSLNLDRRYEAIARCVAWLCLSDGSAVRRSYSAEEIGSVAQAYETPALAADTAESFGILLDEMVDMGLLLRTQDRRYRLRRDSLLDIVGRDQAVLEEQLADQAEVRA